MPWRRGDPTTRMNTAPIGKRRSIDVPIKMPCAFWYVGISSNSPKPPKLPPVKAPDPEGVPDELGPPELLGLPLEVKGFESEDREAAVRSKVN
jgi:hypothetical protein